MEDAKEYDQKMLYAISKKTYPHSAEPTGEASMAREIIRLREANERLHEKLGETIDECSALRHKLNKALGD